MFNILRIDFDITSFTIRKIWLNHVSSVLFKHFCLTLEKQIMECMTKTGQRERERESTLGQFSVVLPSEILCTTTTFTTLGDCREYVLAIARACHK